MNHSNQTSFRTLATLMLSSLALGACGGGSSGGGGQKFEQAKLLIEHNATDEDTGFQGFADGDPWGSLTITDPAGTPIATFEPQGSLSDLGLTELFFETSEPPNDEVSIAQVLARLAEGDYRFAVEFIEGGEKERAAAFQHAIPEGPDLVSPADGAVAVDAANTVIDWNPVSMDIDGGTIGIAGYQVIVEEEADPFSENGFAKPVFSAYVPSSVTSMSVPPEFMNANSCYKYEVLAIEPTGNQTLSSASFATGTGICVEEEDEEEEPAMKVGKILIEHNASDADTGFQIFADGDPWNTLTVRDTAGASVLLVTAQGGLNGFGLTELFWESSEPENRKVPIADVLARLAEGTYTLTGDMVGGGMSSVTAELSHAIPVGPTLLTPADGDENVDASNTVVSWQPVTTDINGQPVNIVGYQVIVIDVDHEEDFPDSFAQPELSLYVPASVTSVSIPPEFMRARGEYEYEVLSIEESGNQTLRAAEFETAR